MKDLTAKIIEIKRFSVHDGDGIRTTVFFKGCPLRCLWCHNPESISPKSELAYYQNKCLSCGECVDICPIGAHTISPNGHVFIREQCIGCGKCEEACLGEALTFYGKKMTVDELLPILLEDRDFYENSGGGITLSGGECLAQSDFCAELLKKCKAAGLNTAVDTCGYVAQESFDKVMPYTDIFLYDLKAFDEDVHIRCTGVSNQRILENLKYLNECGKNVEIRIPFVPEYNDDQVEKIANFLKTLKNVTKVRVLPYHNYAGSKYLSLGKNNTLPERVPTQEELAKAESYFNNLNYCH